MGPLPLTEEPAVARAQSAAGLVCQKKAPGPHEVVCPADVMWAKLIMICRMWPGKTSPESGVPRLVPDEVFYEACNGNVPLGVELLYEACDGNVPLGAHLPTMFDGGRFLETIKKYIRAVFYEGRLISRAQSDESLRQTLLKLPWFRLWERLYKLPWFQPWLVSKGLSMERCCAREVKADAPKRMMTDNEDYSLEASTRTHIDVIDGPSPDDTAAFVSPYAPAPCVDESDVPMVQSIPQQGATTNVITSASLTSLAHCADEPLTPYIAQDTVAGVPLPSYADVQAVALAPGADVPMVQSIPHQGATAAVVASAPVTSLAHWADEPPTPCIAQDTVAGMPLPSYADAQDVALAPGADVPMVQSFVHQGATNINERPEHALAVMASCDGPSNELTRCRRDQGSAAALVFRLRKETLELDRRAAESHALLEREELRLDAINAKLSLLTNGSETLVMPMVQTSLMDLLLVIPKQAPKSSPERKNLCTAVEVTIMLHIAGRGTSITKTRDDIRCMGTIGNTTLRQNPNGTFWNIADKVWTARHRENSTAWVGTTTEGNEVFLTLQKPPMLVKEPVKQKAAPKPGVRNRSKAVKGVRRTVG